jgi:hypothetical protein
MPCSVRPWRRSQRSSRRPITIRTGAETFDPLRRPAAGRGECGNVEMGARGAAREAACGTARGETRGEMEKRQHHEVKRWRLEEKDLRRQRNKVNKRSGPSGVDEKKRLLHEIKTKDAELTARHARELAGLGGEAASPGEAGEAGAGADADGSSAAGSQEAAEENDRR